MKKLFLASSFAMLIGTAHAQGITRNELNRADLTGNGGGCHALPFSRSLDPLDRPYRFVSRGPTAPPKLSGEA